jgi:hypothetical protein
MDWLRAQRELRQSVMRPWTVKWWVALVAVCALSTLGSAAQTVLLPKGSVWKYSTAFQAGWRGTNFDDQAWLSGPAPLGYGRGDEATVISTDGPIPPITTYFRRALVVTNDLPVLTLTLRLLRDDAAVVFLNDIEVYRSNLPNGPINGLTTALLPVDGSAEDDFHQAPIFSRLNFINTPPDAPTPGSIWNCWPTSPSAPRASLLSPLPTGRSSRQGQTSPFDSLPATRTDTSSSCCSTPTATT